MKVSIWTYGYFPFSFGGGNNKIPIKTEVEADSFHELGKGIKGYHITSPNGKTIVAESEGGGIVGDSIDNVKRDIETADPKIIEKQIEESKQKFKQAKFIPENDFWEMFK